MASAPDGHCHLHELGRIDSSSGAHALEVLAVDGFRDPGIARETLLVGMSRARDVLVVCGDAAQLREVGGKALVKRLRRAATQPTP